MRTTQKNFGNTSILILAPGINRLDGESHNISRIHPDSLKGHPLTLGCVEQTDGGLGLPVDGESHLFDSVVLGPDILRLGISVLDGKSGERHVLGPLVLGDNELHILPNTVAPGCFRPASLEIGIF